MSTPETSVVEAFNAAINARDLPALTALMTEDHRFVDPGGQVVDGRASCTAAWRGFFLSFPDYRNVFTRLEAVGEGVVDVTGSSECSEPALSGPARWRAVVRAGRIAEWQVMEA
jgi:ketosteroid isomerase-like protein